MDQNTNSGELSLISGEHALMQDVVEDLEDFATLGRAGHFQSAFDMFDEVLHPHVHIFAVAIEQISLLIEQGCFRAAFRAVSSLLEDQKMPDGQRIEYTESQKQLLKLLLYVAKLSTSLVPPFEDAISEARYASRYVASSGIQDLNDIQLQILLVRLRILTIGRNSSAVIPDGDFSLPGYIAEEGNVFLNQYPDAIRHLFVNGQLWEAVSLGKVLLQQAGYLLGSEVLESCLDDFLQASKETGITDADADILDLIQDTIHAICSAAAVQQDLYPHNHAITTPSTTSKLTHGSATETIDGYLRIVIEDEMGYSLTRPRLCKLLSFLDQSILYSPDRLLESTSKDRISLFLGQSKRYALSQGDFAAATECIWRQLLLLETPSEAIKQIEEVCHISEHTNNLVETWQICRTIGMLEAFPGHLVIKLPDTMEQMEKNSRNRCAQLVQVFSKELEISQTCKRVQETFCSKLQSFFSQRGDDQANTPFLLRGVNLGPELSYMSVPMSSSRSNTQRSRKSRTKTTSRKLNRPLTALAIDRSTRSFGAADIRSQHGTVAATPSSLVQEDPRSRVEREFSHDAHSSLENHFHFHSSDLGSNLSLAQFRDHPPSLFWIAGNSQLSRPVDLSFADLEPDVRRRCFLDILDWSDKSIVQAICLKNLDGSMDQVAGKIAHLSIDNGERQKKEVYLLNQVRHKHVVAVIGSFSMKTLRSQPSIGILIYPLAPLNLEKMVNEISRYNTTQAHVSTWAPHPRMPHLLSYYACLCSTLLHLHRRKNPIKHRDIKPTNILIDKDDDVMLTDFDISKEYDTVKKAITIGVTEYTIRYAPGYLLNRQAQLDNERGLEWDSISIGFVFLEMATVSFGRSIEEMIKHLEFDSDSDSDSAKDVVYSEALSRGKVETWLLILEDIALKAPRGVPGELCVRAGPFLNAIRELTTCRINDDGPLDRAVQAFKGLGRPCLHCRHW